MHQAVKDNLFLQILKYEQPEPTSEENEDYDINELNKRIERQESNISNMLSSNGKWSRVDFAENLFWIGQSIRLVYEMSDFR